MDLTNHEALSMWLTHYGSFVLFFLLVLGIIALPVPEETLMVLSGILMSKGHLNIPFTILAAYAGSIAGITTSYWLGRTGGVYLLKKYEAWHGITEKHFDRVKRYGKWALLIGYFIPGVRHLTGFSFGMTNLDFKQFAIFAYTGAVIWVTTFLSIGYFVGELPPSIFENIEIRGDEVILGLIFLFALYFFYLFIKQILKHEDEEE
jgi:membrane protein DedA with SNARE-associated domain